MYMNNKWNDICGEKNTEKNSELQMGFEPTTFHTLVGCSTYGLFTNLSEFRSILLPMFIQFMLSNLQINVFHNNESDACVIKSTVYISSNDQQKVYCKVSVC